MSKNNEYSHQKQNHIFIDPPNCGSSVGYRMYVESREVNAGPPSAVYTTHSLEATVTLTDCNRLIDWSFYWGGDTNDDNVAKIDAAIALLQEFRAEYVKTYKLVNKLNKAEVTNGKNSGRGTEKPQGGSTSS